MIKGCQREMVMMQTGDSPLFESAYFILRRQQPPRCKADMLAEANRIIGASSEYFGGKRRRLHGVWLFWIGFLCGIAVLLPVVLLTT
jgi:hypothetical protein